MMNSDKLYDTVRSDYSKIAQEAEEGRSFHALLLSVRCFFS